MAAFETVELFAGNGALLPRTGQREAAVAGLDVDVVALDARNLSGQDVGVGGFVKVDRRLPAGRPWCKPVQALLDGEEIAEGIPTCERHVGIVAPLGAWAGAGGPPC